jgi:hypothetical protein
MNDPQRPSIDEDFTVETAHPTPPDSPRPLGNDGLIQPRDIRQDREVRDSDLDASSRPKTD